jgi:segregation and condensation protein B
MEEKEIQAAETQPDLFTAEQLLGEQEQPAPETDARSAELKAILEAVVYLLSEPAPAAQIAAALGRPVSDVEPLLRELVEDTAKPGRGIQIREVAGGYQMGTKPEHHDVIRTFVKNLKQPLKLSQAALETLAVIAYKQPVTAPEIMEIRGVQGVSVLKTLLDRKLITTAGRKNVIGRPIQYKTTKDFLVQFGLSDLNELPTLKEFEEIRRQSMADEEFEQQAQPAAEPAAPAEEPPASAGGEPAPASGPVPEAALAGDPEPEPAPPPDLEPAPEDNG